MKLVECREAVLARLGGVFNRSEYTDVEFYLPGHRNETIEAHRLVLSSQSDVFRNQLLGSFKEKTMDRVPLDQDIVGHTISHFKAFLGFMYTGEITLTDCNVIRIMKLASFYDLETLRTQCEVYLAEHITIDSVSVLYVESLAIHKPLLRDRCLRVIKNNLEAVMSTQAFRSSVPRETCREIISSDDLNISEVALFIQVREYIVSNCLMDPLDLLECVRLNQISSFDLVNTVAPTGMYPLDWIYSALANEHATESTKTRLIPQNNVERSGLTMLSPLAWRTCGDYTERLGETSIKGTSTKAFGIALADQMVLDGWFQYSIRILHVAANSHWDLGIGFARAGVDLSHYLSASDEGWGFFTTGGLSRSYIAHDSANCSNLYGRDFLTGDIVTVRFEKGAVSFDINGDSLGVAFRSVPLDVYPAVHLRNGSTVEILQ